jgi:DNA repair exonuclease SbcCD ATPase subunit
MSMRIISLTASNIKRLTAIDITPTGDVVEITGRNKQGKSSCLDSILFCLAGERAIQSQPIRDGHDKAVIVIDLGDMKATRRFTRQEDGTFTTTLTLENSDGARYPGPQERLNKLIEAMSFDPGAFVDAKPAAQVATLRSLTGVDFTDLNRKRQEAFDERTAKNRTAKEMRGAAASVQVPDHAPETEISVTEVLQRIEDSSAFNSDLERRQANRRAADERIKTIGTEIEAVRKQIEALEAEREELHQRLTKAGPLPEPKDISALRAEADAAAVKNTAFQAVRRRADFEARALAAEEVADQLTVAIEECDAAKVKMIAEAKMPVEGLGFGDGVVTLHGLPFDQASDAEQLEVSLAIVSAMNPDLRVARVRDGSRLDRDAMTLLEKFAKERDLQVWIERVESDRPGAIVIEDGAVKGINPPEKKAAKARKGTTTQGALL